MIFSRPVAMRAIRIAFSFASVPELQKKVLVSLFRGDRDEFLRARARALE